MLQAHIANKKVLPSMNFHKDNESVPASLPTFNGFCITGRKMFDPHGMFSVRSNENLMDILFPVDLGEDEGFVY